MRQYELTDCLEDAKVGEEYTVIRWASNNNITCNTTELTVGFGNPKTKNVVWVPHNSDIAIKNLFRNQKYTIFKGKLFQGRQDKLSQSPVCIKDSEGQKKSLYDIMGEVVIINSLGDYSSISQLDQKTNPQQMNN